MPLRMRVHDRETIGAALRRFKKLLERSGLTKELRKRKHYEKPCEVRRRAELRKKSTIRKAKLPGRTDHDLNVVFSRSRFSAIENPLPNTVDQHHVRQ